MSYLRVIPRDLFNEAKLLKCIGQIALIIHDGVGVPRELELLHDDSEFSGFNVEQDESDGSLYCSNIELKFKSRLIGLRCPYNNKDAYPLRFVLDDLAEPALTETGKLSDELKSALAALAR